MAYITNISPGAPPLLWSNIDQAFKQINQNFTELQLYLNDSTITPIDLTNLFTDLSPGDSAQFSLGSIDKKWKSVFTSSFSSVPGNELNGLWIGSAQIKGTGITVNLPANSTVGGDPETGIGTDLIIDPDKTFFKTLRIDSSDDIIAPDFNSILNLESGTAISLSANTSNQTLTINNSGVTSLTASTGISISSPSGIVTLTNTGVTSLGPTSILPVGLSAGSGISVNSSTGAVTITNTGVISVAGGFGITVSTDTSTGVATISNAAPAQVTFRDFIIDGDSADPIQADNLSDSFFLNSEYGIILTKDTATDTLTIGWDQRSDLIGSVFSDDSTLLVDSVEGKIVGEISSNIGSITNLASVNFDVENISAIGVSGVNIGAGGFNNLVVTAGAVTVQNFALIATAGIQGNLSGDVTGTVTGTLNGNVNGDLVGSVFADTSTMMIDGTSGKIVGPLEGNTFTGTLNFSGSTWNNVPGSSSVSVTSDVNDFINSGNVNFSYAVGDRSASFNINFSTPLIETSKVRIAELQSNIIRGDLIGSVFSDTSSMIINGTDGSLMYYPNTPGDWDGTAPSTVGEAIDRLAALLKVLNSGTGA
jgi:hypothetical protein